MSVLGIIAEFNPFHNGHKYLIEKAKKETGADSCIVIMSGNFVQRGEPALMDKFSRAEIATKYGADIVIELPTFASTASAEGFAYGAVSLLDSLNVVDTIAFGCEIDNIELINKISDILLDESNEFKSNLKSLCENGDSYPVARSKAIIDLLDDDIKNEAQLLLSSSNAILAIEYIKALKRLKSSIKPYPIKRIGAMYNDTDSYDTFSSASGIRSFIKNKNEFCKCVPSDAFEIIKNYDETRGFLFEDDIFPILYYKLITTDKETLSKIVDCNEFISNKISNSLYNIKSYEDLINTLSSKDYTVSRIKRVLIHILLDIDERYVFSHKCNDYLSYYGRVLACVNESLLARICIHSTIKIITKSSNLYDSDDLNILTDIKANRIYQSIVTAKYGHTALNEFRQNIFPHKTKG